MFNLEEEKIQEMAVEAMRRRPLEDKHCETHVHEFLGSTKLADCCLDRHNHRFAGVTTREIPVKGSHVHGFSVNTDSFGHHHEVTGLTGLPIEVCNGRHIHFADGCTTENDGHSHEYQFATLIENPTLPEHRR